MGHETSLTLMEEHRLWVFEDKMLRKIFGPQRKKLTGKWRKLCSFHLKLFRWSHQE